MKKVFLIILCLLLAGCSERTIALETGDINVFTYEDETFAFDLHSHGYLLVDLSDFVRLYALNNDVPMYPASLTKVLTMDTVLNLESDLSQTSSLSREQLQYLIDEDASLAYIHVEEEYTLKDLLYALMLPSGADGALALENYFAARGIDLVAEMNRHALEIGCTNSHFVNTTGLHDDDHYTSLDDLFLIVMDALKFEEGRHLLESLFYTMEDGQEIATGIRLISYNAFTEVLGGKTGYTPEAGQNVIVLYKYRGKSYVLMLANAMGSYSLNQYWHYDDALTVFENLY